MDSGDIPAHLHAIVQIILVEDDERQDEHGPCMELFIQDRLMETLCALCLIDKPTGVRRLILGAINSIIGNLKTMYLLIPQITIHQPLANLMAGMATMQLGAELQDALTLIKTCLGLIGRDPTLGEFFLVVPPEGKNESEFAIWSALASLFKRTTPEQRERVEELLLRSINSASSHVMAVIFKTEFHVRLVEDLLGLFAHLPTSLPSGRAIDSEQLYRYKLHVRFCNALTSPLAGLNNVPNPFSDALQLHLEDSFLELSLVPALDHATGSLLTRDTLVVKETLQLLSGPLQDALVSLTVGLQAAALCETLCARMLSSDVGLAAATLRFFDVVCGLYHAHAYESLMLSHLATVPLPSDPEAAAAAAAVSSSAGATFEPILESFPAAYTHDRSSGSSLDSYTLHARGVIAQVADLHEALGVAPDMDRSWDHHATISLSSSNSEPFLDALFAKLRQYSLLSLKDALLVTSLVSRILKYPSRPLFERVAHATLESVALLAAEAELHVTELNLSPDVIRARLAKSYVTLSALRDFELSSDQDPSEVFFQKTVILDEFVRELVAIDSARLVYAIENGY